MLYLLVELYVPVHFPDTARVVAFALSVTSLCVFRSVYSAFQRGGAGGGDGRTRAPTGDTQGDSVTKIVAVVIACLHFTAGHSYVLQIRVDGKRCDCAAGSIWTPSIACCDTTVYELHCRCFAKTTPKGILQSNALIHSPV